MTSKLLVAGFAAALALSACTSTNPYTQQTQLSNTSKGALIGTGTGAVTGALIGAATGNDPRIGALIDQSQALKGRLYPADIARMALFLAADDSQMISGQDFLVDGGWAHG